jgi:pimeloyl-ACP methyl ester carboxylesterase
MTKLEPIVGRYTTIRILDTDCRIYFEEAGAGIPLVCLHTAGADCRQFRHMMNDEEITQSFRVLTFDYPWHGKSTPPVGYHKYEYKLTLERYVEMIRAFCRALELDRPVALGCSVGGHVILELANSYGKEFRALIGMETADSSRKYIDDLSNMYRPDVHGGEYCAAHCSGLIAPTSPDEYRHETLWMYMQSGPGVHLGDLYSYWNRLALDGIDTKTTPLYLLTGEYDYAYTPEDTLRAAAMIPGAKATIMKGLGHFPMSENPKQFREYILPVLQEIKQLGLPAKATRT